MQLEILSQLSLHFEEERHFSRWALAHTLHLKLHLQSKADELPKLCTCDIIRIKVEQLIPQLSACRLLGPFEWLHGWLWQSFYKVPCRYFALKLITEKDGSILF